MCSFKILLSVFEINTQSYEWDFNTDGSTF
jgi:hypothetical protein